MGNWYDDSEAISDMVNDDDKVKDKIEEAFGNKKKKDVFADAVIDDDDTNTGVAKGRGKVKSKKVIDKDKVAWKLANLTDEEVNMVLEDKQRKQEKKDLRSEKVGKATNTTLKFLWTFIYHFFCYFLEALYYVGMGLAFCLEPMMLYDYIHVSNGIGKDTKKIAKPYTGRDTAGNVSLFLVFILKFAAWFVILNLAAKYFLGYEKYIVGGILFTIIYACTPFYKLGIKGIENWKKMKSDRDGKKDTQTEKAKEQKQFTRGDITDKDIIKYFKDEVTVIVTEEEYLTTVEVEGTEVENDE